MPIAASSWPRIARCASSRESQQQLQQLQWRHAVTNTPANLPQAQRGRTQTTARVGEGDGMNLFTHREPTTYCTATAWIYTLCWLIQLLYTASIACRFACMISFPTMRQNLLRTGLRDTTEDCCRRCYLVSFHFRRKMAVHKALWRLFFYTGNRKYTPKCFVISSTKPSRFW